MRANLFGFCVLALVCLLATASSAQAQLIRGYGIKAGVSSSNIQSSAINLGESGPVSFDTKRRTGFDMFAFVEWMGASPVSLVTEVGYVQRGFATEQEARDANNNPLGAFRVDDRFDYLSFAAHAKLRWPQGILAPYVLGGPHVNVLLSGSPGGEGSIASIYSTTAVGGTVGVGVEVVRHFPVAVFAEVRYSFDLTNSLPDVPRDAFNNAFDVLLGVRL